jgi:hypothetical protein
LFHPTTNLPEPWEFDREMHKRRLEVERRVRCPKNFHRVFSRFDTLDLMLLAFINFALVVKGFR